jgi:hypothetical protein
MPLYTYQNPKTGKEEELISSYAERDNQVCDDTGVKLVRKGIEQTASNPANSTYFGLVQKSGQFLKTRKA